MIISYEALSLPEDGNIPGDGTIDVSLKKCKILGLNQGGLKGLHLFTMNN